MAHQRYSEARLILPVPVAPAHTRALEAAEAALVAAFGGFTRQAAAGAWQDGEGCIVREGVYVYDVAVPFLSGSGEDSGREWAGAMTQLRYIAMRAAQAMEQACVYLRSPAGRVHLITPDGRDFNPDIEPHPYPRAR